MIGTIYAGQMEYNARPRYNLSQEILATKIMPTDAEIRNGAREIVPAEKPTNWGPLVVAAALAFVAMG